MEDYLKEIPADRSVIPESCISFSEMADYLAEYNKCVLNECISEIGNYELSVLESTGNSVVYVDEAATRLKKSLVKCVERSWAANKNFYEKVLAKFSTDAQAAKKVLKVNDSTIENLDDKSFGSVHTFDGLDNIDFSENARLFSKEVEKVFKVMTAETSKSSIDKAKALLENETIEAISTVSASSIREMKKALKTKMIGDTVKVDKTWIKNNKGKLKEVVISGSSVIAIREAYNKEKKIYNSIIDIINGLEDDFSNIIVAWESVLYDMLNVMHACYAVEMDVYKKRFAEYRLIATKIDRTSISEAMEIVPVEEESTVDEIRIVMPPEEIQESSIVIDDFNRTEDETESCIQYDASDKEFKF